MDAAFKALADLGVAIVGLVFVAWFAYWVVKKLLTSKDDQIADLRKQRDVNQEGWKTSVAALEQLTSAVRERNDLLDRLLSK